MRLLVVSPWSPYPPDNGSRLRAWHLIRLLARSHELDLVAGRQDDSPETVPAELAALCDRTALAPWLWHRPGATGARGALRAALSPTPRSILETPNPTFAAAVRAGIARRPDAVLAFELAADPFLPARAGGPPVVLDQVEVSGMESAFRSAVGARQRAARGLTRWKGARHWSGRLRRYAALTAVSEPEADAVRRLVGDSGPPVEVVPNGVAAADYPAPTGAPTPGRMIYPGALSYGPNRDAVLWFVEEILPEIAGRVPDAHLIVTGREAGAPAALETHPRVRLTGYLDDLRPTLADAAVCVVPLRAGGGTRLKILEAWAARLPVVSTTIGVSGLAARDGEHYLCADTPAAFADACVALLESPDTRRRLAEAARARVEERYDWERSARMLETLLRRADERSHVLPGTLE